MVAPAGKDAPLLHKNHDDPIVIIGGGIGGLSAAIYLATAGENVVVLEQQSQLGGKMGQYEADGFRWDTGPSVITMRHVFEDLFAAAGKSLDDYLTLLPLEPLTRYFYTDGTVFDATADISRMVQQIEAINPRDVEGYLKFLAYAARIYRITSPAFIYNQPPSWRSFLQFSPFDALQIDGLRTMQQSIEGFVKSPQLRQLLARFATYTGASPYLAPATLNVIAHVELAGGVWYPDGGIYSIANAMQRLAQDVGVEVHLGCPAQQIIVENGHVRGVQVEGELMPAKAVIANVDVATVYKHLLPNEPSYQQRQQQLAKAEPSCSGFIMLLGVEGETPQLAHHNIFFSPDYQREFNDIFKREVPPTNPTIYVAITSKTNPEHAPANAENWFVLVNAPALSDKWSWQNNTDTYRNLVLDKLARYGVDVRDRIRTEKLMTPHDLEHMTGARRGALYGASSNNRWAAFKRPHNRANDIRGLYFAGGTTHPGGGVPMVTLSGKLAANLLLKDIN